MDSRITGKAKKQTDKLPGKVREVLFQLVLENRDSRAGKRRLAELFKTVR